MEDGGANPLVNVTTMPMVIVAEANALLLATEVAVIVTEPPDGAVAGAV
jgi:hypothetical protein